MTPPSPTKHSHYFTSSPDWEAYYTAHSDYAPKSKSGGPTTSLVLDVAADRQQEATTQAAWVSSHPLESFGYSAHYDSIASARDGYAIGLKIYYPLASRVKEEQRKTLPLLFVTHAGGWVQGTYVTEESWLLHALLPRFEFVVVSVGYRLAPEWRYPTYVEDCWDALKAMFETGEGGGGPKSVEIDFDRENCFLAGSSAGGCLAAVMAQKMRDEPGMEGVVKGVLMNVPETCHPDFFPRDKYSFGSYDECFGTLLSSAEMRAIWELVIPNQDDGKDPQVSPLLAEIRGLPPHAIFVAGQDPPRDEGIAYAERLEKEGGVEVRLHVYQGVPHNFAEIEELETRQRFLNDLVDDVAWLLHSSNPPKSLTK